MRIYLNRMPNYGPWGGGIKLVNALVERLSEAGHDVVFRLREIPDVIVCFDPRPAQWGERAMHFVQFLRDHPRTRLICRVGDCGTHGKPQLMSMWMALLPHATSVVYPSQWARDYMSTCVQMQGAFDTASRSCVIANGALNCFFAHRRDVDAALHDPIKLVTSHWSDNEKKGFRLYEQLDEILSQHDQFQLTFIGRKPSKCSINRHVLPMSADELARELPRHDIYITASLEEAGANHVLEAMACGLPVVYSTGGGSIGEYCSSYGAVGYNSWDVDASITAIDQVVADYVDAKTKTMKFDRTIDDVVDEYITLICETQ